MSKRRAKKKAQKKLASRFHQFLETHPPQQVSRHLRCIMLDYIGSQALNGLPVDFDIYAWELYDLFNLLDAAEDAQPKKCKM